MKLEGVLNVDGEEQRIKGDSITLRVSNRDGAAQVAAATTMGTQVTETISISGDKMVTTVTVRSGDTTNTTTTTVDISTDDSK